MIFQSVSTNNPKNQAIPTSHLGKKPPEPTRSSEPKQDRYEPSDFERNAPFMLAMGGGVATMVAYGDYVGALALPVAALGGAVVGKVAASSLRSIGEKHQDPQERHSAQLRFAVATGLALAGTVAANLLI